MEKLKELELTEKKSPHQSDQKINEIGEKFYKILKSEWLDEEIKNQEEIFSDLDYKDLKQEDTILDEIFQEKLKEKIDEIFKNFLDKREAKILNFIFFEKKENQEKYTLEEIGKIFWINGERVRQIKIKALRKIRESNQIHKISDFVEKDILKNFYQEKIDYKIKKIQKDIFILKLYIHKIPENQRTIEVKQIINSINKAKLDINNFDLEILNQLEKEVKNILSDKNL